jgi:hypothetical protein
VTLANEGYVGDAGAAEMHRDWEQLRDEILDWYVFGTDCWPNLKPWVFLLPEGPGFRPWAWWQLDAPEPLGENETERAFLERHGLFLPGEAEHPTMDQQRAAKDAAQQAEINARIEANLAEARR